MTEIDVFFAPGQHTDRSASARRVGRLPAGKIPLGSGAALKPGLKSQSQGLMACYLIPSLGGSGMGIVDPSLYHNPPCHER